MPIPVGPISGSHSFGGSPSFAPVGRAPSGARSPTSARCLKRALSYRIQRALYARFSEPEARVLTPHPQTAARALEYINITTGGSGPPRIPWPMAIKIQEQMKHSHLKNYKAIARATTSRVLGGGAGLARGSRGCSGAPAMLSHELSSPPTKCSGRPCLN